MLLIIFNTVTGKSPYTPKQKRRAITIKEGTKTVINPSIPLLGVYL